MSEYNAAYEITNRIYGLEIGQIKVVNKSVRVGCKDGALTINEVIPEGKKQMDAISWINGFQDKSDLKFS
jgi:methionyl-tRNA formyltransferase